MKKKLRPDAIPTIFPKPEHAIPALHRLDQKMKSIDDER